MVRKVHQTQPKLQLLMLRVTTLKKRSKVVLTVEGRLAGDSVSTLEQCWRELRAASPTEKFNVDLCGVSFIDAAGKTLLKEIYRQGGRLVAQGCLNQETVKEITGAAEGRSESESKKDTKRSHIIFYIAFFSLLLAPTLTPAHSQRQQNPLPAEAPYSGVMRLTLDQAVALALKQNTTAQIAVLSAAQSDQDQKIAMSALLPEAQLGVSEQWQRINILAQFGGTRIFPGFPAHVGPYSTFSAGPSVDGPIFDLTLFRRYQASRNAANASKADSLSTREQVMLGDSLSFFDTPQPDVEASIEEGLSARHEWKSLQEQMRAAENQRKAAFAERLPAVHFSGSWEQFGTEPVSVIPTYTYAGTVSVPLFTGGRIRAETVR